MDRRTNVSFIPKKPLVKKINRSKRPVGIFLFLAYFIFFLTLASYGILYFYYSNLKVVLVEKTAEFEMEKAKADPAGIIEEAEVLQARISSVENLLEKHVAPSRLFELLEEVTLENIVFNDFLFEKVNVEQQAVGAPVGTVQSVSTPSFVVQIKGKALSYASLAYQSDVLKEEIEKNQRVKRFLIKNVTLDEVGNILFDLDLTLSSSLLSYKGMFNNKILLEEAPVLEEEISEQDGLDTVSPEEIIEDLKPVDIF